MAVKPHTTRWPDGTPRSTANAFAWRDRQAAGIDSIIAADYTHCTALYNAWRADQRSGHGKGARMTWPEYRASQTPKTKDVAHRTPGGQINGFGKNGGTIVGLSDKADAMLARQAPKPRVKGGLMPIAGHALQRGKVTAPHSGAYTRAGTKGGSAKIHKPAGKKAGKVAAS